MDVRTDTVIPWFARCLGGSPPQEGLQTDNGMDLPVPSLADETDVSLLEEALPLLTKSLMLSLSSQSRDKLYDPAMASTICDRLGPAGLLQEDYDKKGLRLAVGSLAASRQMTETSGALASTKVIDTAITGPTSEMGRIFGWQTVRTSESVLGAITTPPLAGDGTQGEFLYLRKVPVFQGGEYNCHLGIDMVALRKHQPNQLTMKKVRDCLVLVKKARNRHLRSPSFFTGYERMRDQYGRHDDEKIAGRSIVPGTLPSAKKTEKSGGQPIDRPIIIQKFYPKGTVEEFLLGLVKSPKILGDKVSSALNMCGLLQDLVTQLRDAGMVCGDLKGLNIAMTEEGQLVICDLGSIQGQGAFGNGSGVINSSVLSTVLFASKAALADTLEIGPPPVLMEGQTVTQHRVETWRRSDLYALGVMQLTLLYNSIFPRDDPYGTLTQITEKFLASHQTDHDLSRYSVARNREFTAWIKKLRNTIPGCEENKTLSPEQKEAIDHQLLLIEKLLYPENYADVKIKRTSLKALEGSQPPRNQGIGPVGEERV